MVDVGAHYRPITGDYPPGVYRVVGTTDEIVLLRVTDGDGRRIHSGAVRSVVRDAVVTDFEPAADPDAGVHPIRAIRNALAGLYWSVRGSL